jgi:uncharacterized iron-regulated membrane protein
MNGQRLHRKIHSWAAICTALPLFIVIVTGLLLQVKKQVPWVQPPTVKGTSATPSASFEQLLAAAKTVTDAGISSWEDVDRIDLRPGHGVAKIRSHTGWELQLDAQSAAVLSSAFRRSDFIESMHDGSFFHEYAKLWIFLPTGLLLLLLWITGLYLWLAPRLNRLLRRRRTVPAL